MGEKIRLTKEELEERMRLKIAQIPKASLTQKQLQERQEKNRQNDKCNLDHTVQILTERREEAEVSQDQKKKFHSIAIEKTEVDQFNNRERIRQLENQYTSMRCAFSEENWQIFSEFWEIGSQTGHNDSELALYFKDMNLDPKDIVHFMSMIKMKNEIEKLKKNL